MEAEEEGQRRKHDLLGPMDVPEHVDANPDDDSPDERVGFRGEDHAGFNPVGTARLEPAWATEHASRIG